MSNKHRGYLLLGGMVCASGALAGELTPDLAARIQSAGPDDPIRVIVTLNEQVDVDRYRGRRRGDLVDALRRHATVTQAPLRADMTRAGVSGVKPLWIINSLAAEVPARLLKSLARRPDVAQVRLDAEATLPPTAPTGASPTWNLSAIRADAVWAEGITGSGTVVASLDTGADIHHPDLHAKWRGGTNSWYDPYGQHVAAPHDGHGHGTQTLGIMVGGDAGGVSIGVAPGSQWIAARIFNDLNTAYTSAIHLAFQWTLDPDGDPTTDDMPDVVVGAWGLLSTNACDAEFRPDIQALKAADIAVAFSAGNSGPSYFTSISPANYPESYAIGAVDESLRLASFSARGPSTCTGGFYPHVVAPGANVRTADLSFAGAVADPYITVSGTSYSAAHVGGAMALLRSAVNAADVTQLEAALNESAVDLGHAGADNAFGHGLVDVMAAYQRLVQATPPPAGDPPPVEEQPPAEEPPPGTGGDAETDADGDGYTVANGDCNDADATIHPGALEVKHDGIDQDCNGYDHTLAITRALYTARRGTLEVIATSQYGAQADPSVHGIGPMTWSATRGTWELRLTTSNPGTVTVTGVEGSEEAHVSVR
ncbi:MAG: S8 family serine peptidase [Gammaproteobacteria bacterium]|nr:S8 family serine peptidase [Gammaproteobacteria bacterium]